MSRNAQGLPNTKEDAKAYIDFIVSQGWVEEVYITGSRSPLRQKQPREDSDWDFLVLSSWEGVKVDTPRGLGMLNSCLTVRGLAFPLPRTACMVYPVDSHHVITEPSKED